MAAANDSSLSSESCVRRARRERLRTAAGGRRAVSPRASVGGEEDFGGAVLYLAAAVALSFSFFSRSLLFIASRSSPLLLSLSVSNRLFFVTALTVIALRSFATFDGACCIVAIRLPFGTLPSTSESLSFPHGSLVWTGGGISAAAVAQPPGRVVAEPKFRPSRDEAILCHYRTAQSHDACPHHIVR